MRVSGNSVSLSVGQYVNESESDLSIVVLCHTAKHRNRTKVMLPPMQRRVNMCFNNIRNARPIFYKNLRKLCKQRNASIYIIIIIICNFFRYLIRISVWANLNSVTGVFLNIIAVYKWYIDAIQNMLCAKIYYHISIIRHTNRCIQGGP